MALLNQRSGSDRVYQSFGGSENLPKERGEKKGTAGTMWNDDPVFKKMLSPFTMGSK